MKSLKSWLNKVFCQNATPDTTEASLNTPVEVINTSDTDGIGEPILSFIETFRSDRKRFVTESIEGLVFSLYDTVTERNFIFYKRRYHEPRLYCNYELLGCFSKRELDYLWLKLMEPEYVRYTKVRVRLENIKHIRKTRLQREQLMEVYCNEI